jgi:hypothetical protein
MKRKAQKTRAARKGKSLNSQKLKKVSGGMGGYFDLPDYVSDVGIDARLGPWEHLPKKTG